MTRHCVDQNHDFGIPTSQSVDDDDCGNGDDDGNVSRNSAIVACNWFMQDRE